MSLKYELKNIENFRTVCFIGDELAPKTKVIIWSMAVLGLGGQITKKNIREACRQFDVLQLVVGPLLFVEGSHEPRLLRDEDIKDHIGLWTNCASPNINTKGAFNRYIAEHLKNPAHVTRRLAECYPNGYDI